MDVVARYRKALLQAGFGRLDAAEATLREVLAAEPEDVTRVRALVVLGDLLCGVGRKSEALPLLEDALAAPRVDDLVDVELDRARALLADHG